MRGGLLIMCASSRNRAYLYLFFSPFHHPFPRPRLMLNLITNAIPDECVFLNNDPLPTPELCVPNRALGHHWTNTRDLTMVLIIVFSCKCFEDVVKIKKKRVCPKHVKNLYILMLRIGTFG